jgi:hypothetical protein
MRQTGAMATRLTLEHVELLSRRMLTACGASDLRSAPTEASIREAAADGLRPIGLSYLPTYRDHVADDLPAVLSSYANPAPLPPTRHREASTVDIASATAVARTGHIGWTIGEVV